MRGLTATGTVIAHIITQGKKGLTENLFVRNLKKLAAYWSNLYFAGRYFH